MLRRCFLAGVGGGGNGGDGCGVVVLAVISYELMASAGCGWFWQPVADCVEGMGGDGGGGPLTEIFIF